MTQAYGMLLSEPLASFIMFSERVHKRLYKHDNS